MKNDLAIFKKVLSRYKLWIMFHSAIRYNLKMFNESHSYYIIDKIIFSITQSPKDFIDYYARMRNITLPLAIYSILDSIIPEWGMYFSGKQKINITYEIENEWRNQRRHNIL